MDKILIDGNEYDADLSGFSIEYGLNDTNTYTYSVGSSISLFGSAAKAIEDTFFLSCQGQQAELNISIYKECCNRWFHLVLDYEGVSYCPSECSAEITPRRVTEESDCYKYLNSTIYWKNGFIDAFEHPKVWYCRDGGFMQTMLMLLTFAIVPIITIINIMLAILRFWCNLFGGSRCSDLGDDIPTPCEYISIAGGCGRYAPSPLIREIFEYHTAQCGLEFKSTIFQDSIYRNTALFQLQYEKGISVTQNTSSNWIEGNGANLTPIQLLEKLQPVFNLDWRIIDGTLCVERRDFFDTLNTNIGSISNTDYCVSYIQDNACAYGRFAYSDDTFDAEGNSMKEETDDIIEWNEDNDDWKDGECTTTADFGRASFNFDKNALDGEGRGFRDEQRSTAASDFLCGSLARNNDLILGGKIASKLKLLVLTEGFNRDDAKTIRRPATDGLYYQYNYPLSYRQFNNDGTERLDGLYAQFHAIEDPNTQTRERMNIDDVEIDLSCELIDLIDSAEAGLSVDTQYGLGSIETVTIDYEKGVIKLSNITVNCDS